MPNFSSDKKQLMNTLARFDGNISVNDVTEDVTDAGTKNKIYSRHYHTFFLHILLENVCNDIEPDEHKREVLFHEVCRVLSESKYLNESLVLDSLLPLRRKLAQQFFNFVKQIHTKVIPDPTENNITADTFLDESDFSTKLELQYRYEQNFEELEVIAKGGFGVVCKARHKVTDIVYAVKKVLFKYKSDSEYLKVIREAKNIAALNHPNIVSYNNAWIECLPLSEIDSEDSRSSSSESNFSSDDSEPELTEDPLSEYSKIFQNSFEKGSSQSRLSSSFPDRFGKINMSQQTRVLTESFSFLSVESRERSRRTASESYVQNQNNIFDSSGKNSNTWVPTCLNVRVMLCIQMEYCNCDLRHWLDRRADGGELPFHMDVMQIFRDILNGVMYIHSKNIIHRDLKPQNIFFSEASNILKIGDFGLATLTNCATGASNRVVSRTHSANLGTIPYAAPEQIKYKFYDAKVDIYSLGIILIELLNVFATKMGFFKAIEEIDKGHFPKEMETNWPLHINLVKNLVRKNPEDRLSAKDILHQLQSLESPETNEILRLQTALTKKDEEITRLKAIVEEQQSIISKQKIEMQE